MEQEYFHPMVSRGRDAPSSRYMSRNGNTAGCHTTLHKSLPHTMQCGPNCQRARRIAIHSYEASTPPAVNCPLPTSHLLPANRCSNTWNRNRDSTCPFSQNLCNPTAKAHRCHHVISPRGRSTQMRLAILASIRPHLRPRSYIELIPVMGDVLLAQRVPTLGVPT